MRRLPLVLTLVLAFTAVTFAPGAGAQSDAERERDRVREERREAAASIDALNADRSEIEQALQDLSEQLASEEAALASAEREVADAEAAEARANEGIEAAEANLAELEDRLREQMVEAYTNPEGTSMASLLDAESATDMVKRRAILSGRTAQDEDLADQVRAAQDELQAQRRAAAAARVRAEEKRQEVQTRIDRVETARAQQETFVEQVQSRINAELARSIELGNRDRALSARIAEEQAQLQALIAYQAEQERQAAAAAEAAAATPPPADDGPTYGEGGSEAAPIAGPGPVSGSGTGTGGIPLCTAAGITVNCAIAENVRALVAAAAADGVTLAGHGYRDPGRQIALRRQNCGSSHYAIYQMPASQCRPPTARPGSSQHEVGLAIDFSQYSFSWLSANASRFGFYNLPGEPWHWSTTGN